MAEKDGKKRKRQSNGTASPSKRVAFDVAASAPVKVVHVDDDGLLPVVVSSPGLNAPPIAFNSYAKPLSSKVSSGQQVRPATHELLLHSSAHPRLNYTATPSSREQQLSHYIAILDPATQILQLSHAHHLDLRSTLRSAEQEAENIRQTFAQQRENLGREFGTKKAKKAILSKTENAITSDPKGKSAVSDVQTAVLESLGHGDPEGDKPAVVRTAQEEQELALRSKPIPFPNLSAESVEEVYPLSTLIPPNDARLVSIKDWQEKIEAGEDIPLFNRYPANSIKKMRDGEVDGHKLQALRYLALLLEFHDALVGGGRGPRKVPKKDQLNTRLSHWPPPLVDSVRRRFANESGSELGKFQLDKLYTHVCALALYHDSWITDATDLRADLKMENSQMAQYFKELGCKVAAPTEAERNARKLSRAQAAVTRIARLRLPLEFPQPRKGRKT